MTTSVFIFQACYGTPVPPADVPRSQTELQEAVPEDPEAPSDVEENLDLARELRIRQAPTLVVNGDEPQKYIGVAAIWNFNSFDV